MQNRHYILIFIVLLGLVNLGERLLLNFYKDARPKKKLLVGFSILNAVIVAGFVWSMIDFKFHWGFFAIFFIPIILVVLLNILTTEFCETCGTELHKWKFWKPFEECLICKNSAAGQNLQSKD